MVRPVREDPLPCSADHSAGSAAERGQTRSRRGTRRSSSTPACRRTARGRCPPCRYCRSPSDCSGSRNQALSFPWTSAPRRARRVSLTAVAIVNILSLDVGGSTWWCCSAEAGRRRVGLRGGKRPGHTLANGDAKPEPSPDHRDEAPPGNREPAWLGTQPDDPGAVVSTRRANRRGTNGSDFAASRRRRPVSRRSLCAADSRWRTTGCA